MDFMAFMGSAMSHSLKYFLFLPHSVEAVRHGAAHEGHEVHEVHEARYEGHEGQESHEGEQDRKGKAGPCSRVRRWQREDQQWHDQGPVGEEQDWQDCEQESVCSGQESVCS